MPASLTAWWPATRANWAKRSSRRDVLASRIASGWKFLTSPPIFTLCLEVSNCSMWLTPLLPARNPSQNPLRSLARGLTVPMPVMTTRRFIV